LNISNSGSAIFNGICLFLVAGAAVLAMMGAAIPSALFSLGAMATLVWIHRSGVTEKSLQNKVERELQESASNADGIIAAIQSGLVGLDREGRICRWNEGATRILGLGRGGIIGQHVDRWPVEGQRKLATLLKEAMAGNTINRGKLDVTRPDGTVIPIGISTSRLGGDGNCGTGAVAIFRDLTEIQKIRDKMQKNERLAAIGTLAASIAHEIRNPLASIAGSVEMLAGELELSGEQEELLDLIIKESDRLNHLITNFLEFTMDQQPKKTEIEPLTVVRKVIRSVEQRGEAGERLVLSVQDDHCPDSIVADPNMLTQVLLNLIINACQSMDWQGKVDVTLAGKQSGQEEMIEFTVSDEGSGIAEEDRPNIFDPFFSTKTGGSGLGLGISHRIAEVHDGQLELVDTDEPGACFRLRIPTNVSGLKPEVAREELTGV
jgi:PAS domain S-box-containing protein